jgi:hypothetical protein
LLACTSPYELIRRARQTDQNRPPLSIEVCLMDKAELVTFDPFQGVGSQNPGLRLI